MAWHYVITDGYGWTSEYSVEQTDNAKEIWDTLVGVYQWTEESVAGVLGNLQAESFINPGQWEIGKNYSRSDGFGLGQWTPSTKISNYIGSTDRDTMSDGAKQLMFLASNPGQYSNYYLNEDGSSTYYGETGLPYITNMEDYSHSTASVSNLTKLWAICWERPGATHYRNSIDRRIGYATHWYNEFTGRTPEPPTPPIPPTPGEAQNSIWYIMLKRRNKRKY